MVKTRGRSPPAYPGKESLILAGDVEREERQLADTGNSHSLPFCFLHIYTWKEGGGRGLIRAFYKEHLVLPFATPYPLPFAQYLQMRDIRTISTA